jgi:hypothetical protein
MLGATDPSPPTTKIEPKNNAQDDDGDTTPHDAAGTKEIDRDDYQGN